MEIKPFKAYRFDSSIVGDVGNCISPPYDVISPSLQQQLYKKSDYNIVRIINGKTTPSDNDKNNQYTRAADYLKGWIEKGILKQDSTENIYAYIQDFELDNRHFQRNSFIALAKLEDFGKAVRPHEETLEEPKIDRLNLKRATKADSGLVFMLYEDQQRIADKIIENNTSQKPLIDFYDEHNVRHRLFAVTAKDDIDAITKMISDKSCIIADGHHRYETALNYARETANPAAAYQMTAFVNTCNEGLMILATHRLVGNLRDFQFEKFMSALKKSFEITEFSFISARNKTKAKQKMSEQLKAACDRGQNTFGTYTGNNAFYVAVLKDKQTMNSIAPNMSEAWRSLDVSVLHKLALEKLLGIGEKELSIGNNVEYIKDTGNAIGESIAKIDEGQKQVAFFMNPPKMQQLRMVTAAGEKMPQKSTYFYPKMHTGLTINKL